MLKAVIVLYKIPAVLQELHYYIILCHFWNIVATLTLDNYDQETCKI